MLVEGTETLLAFQRRSIVEKVSNLSVGNLKVTFSGYMPFIFCDILVSVNRLKISNYSLNDM